jgi:enoyl-CoA hydratase/carnithine racemase
MANATMNYETILVDVAEGVATITLNRPDRMNAFNRGMVRDFRALWAAVRLDPEVRAIVLRAAPGRAFCIGVDVKEGWHDTEPGATPFDTAHPGDSLGPKSNQVWKPLVVAVSGMAAAGAFYWINEADIVICSEDATFFDTHVSFGTVSSAGPVGAMGRIPHLEIVRLALMSSEERIGAETARRISLVTEVTPLEVLWGRADEIGRSLAAKSPVAVQGTVRALWESQGLPHAQAVQGATHYSQIGNREGFGSINMAAPKVPWRVR